jgi:4-amino-4-deoxy-L-arabinose transferase-like glycosyltransferase
MKRKIRESYVLLGILVILLLLPHIPFLGNNYVDVEPLYVDAGSQIALHGVNADLSDYFGDIANPALTALALSASYKLFWESPMISRLTIFVLSLIFSLFLYFYIRNKKKGPFVAFVSVLLVIVNPMFIVYSQYVMSDGPFLVFSSISLLLFFFSSSVRGRVVSSVMLGISFATKYVAVVLFPVVVVYSLIESKIWEQLSLKRLLPLLRFNSWYIALSLLVSAPVISIAFFSQQGILSSNLASRHSLNLALFGPHLFSYLLWLGLFIGPSSLMFALDLYRKLGRNRFLIVIVGLIVSTFIISRFIPISSLHVQSGSFGEMNLSWVESAIPPPYLSVVLFFVLLVAEVFLVSAVFDSLYSKEEKITGLLIWIVVPIMLMSLTRVANRYMLVTLTPLSIYAAFVAGRMYLERRSLFVPIVLTLHAVIFLTVGYYSNYYLYQRGLEALSAF